jgi:hypothetical protein
MARFSKQRLDEMDDYQSIRNSRLTKEEQKTQDEEARAEILALKEMQECISKELAAYMAKHGIGIVKLTDLLQTSTRQTNRIMTGEANVTLATIANIAQLMGKKPRIVFE